MWWPGIDANMEDELRKCHACQSEQKSPHLAPVHSWQWPDYLWNCVHIGYAGPFMGKIFLLLDAHSKWIDIHMSSTSSSQSTIEKLRQSFAMFGLPKVLVSDNGTSFTSQEFQYFIRQKGRYYTQKKCPVSPCIQWTC